MAIADITQQFVGSIQGVLSAVTQELMVIVVFFFSLLLWKHIGNRSKSGKPPKVVVSSPKTPSKHPSSPKTASKHPSGSVKVLDATQLKVLQAAEASMMQLLEQREFTRALNYYRTFERDGQDRAFSEATVSAFVQSAIRVGKLDVVERLLHSAKRHGRAPSSEFWRTTLKMLSSRKHLDTCLAIHQHWGSSLPADKVVFSCLINGALEHGTPERAATMLDRYCQAGLDPKDYVLLFRTYAAVNDVDSAEKVFRDLGPNMSSLMTNLLLLTCVKAKQPERAMDRLHEACEIQKTRPSVGDANAVDNEPMVDVVSYNTVIKGFAQAGMLPRCFDCLHEMRSRNLEPDDVTFGTLLDLCVSDNDMSSANEVVSLLMNKEKPVDTVMCTLFIKALVRAQKLPKALEIYEEMKRAANNGGAKPDIVTFSILIKASVDIHDLEQALKLLEDMVGVGQFPDDIILTHLLEGCRYVGNHALGKKLFADMLAVGVKPSEFTLISMLKLHGRCGAHEEAYQLVAKWESLYGAKPSVIHYTCLMSGCLRTKNYDQAWLAYKLMLEMDVQPDDTAMATLLPSMVAAQKWQRVVTLVEVAFKSQPRITISPDVLNSALKQMRAATANGPASELQILMQAANVRIHR